MKNKFTCHKERLPHNRTLSRLLRPVSPVPTLLGGRGQSVESHVPPSQVLEGSSLQANSLAAEMPIGWLRAFYFGGEAGSIFQWCYT